MFHRLEDQGDREKFFSASVTRLQLHGAVMSLTRDDIEGKMCFIFPTRSLYVLHTLYQISIGKQFLG
jgi:hypothetical protein